MKHNEEDVVKQLEKKVKFDKLHKTFSYTASGKVGIKSLGKLDFLKGKGWRRI